MAKHQFKIILEQDEDGYLIASVPALPGCYTQAKTLPELKKGLKKQFLCAWKKQKKILNIGIG